MTELQSFLEETEGTSYSIRDFVERHISVLTPTEQQVVRTGFQLLPDSIPANLSKPVKRVSEQDPENGSRRKIQTLGRRSAYDADAHIKFKGCSPPAEPKPHANRFYFFGDDRFRIVKDSFGVMEPESVMRELLAISFLEQEQLPNVLHPLCVYEYKPSERTAGYCLVMHSEHNERLPDMDPDQDANHADHLRLAIFDQQLFRKLVPFQKVWMDEQTIQQWIANEAQKKGMSIEDYVRVEKEKLLGQYDKPFGHSPGFVEEAIEKQTELLITFQFRGLLRNMANGHNENTIISPSREYFLCDFETAAVIPIPAHADEKFLRDFCLAGVIESMELDFRYVAFVPHADLSKTPENRAQAFHSVFDKYSGISELFRRYHERFYEECRARGWAGRTLDRAIESARDTPVFADQALLRIDNDFVHAFYPFSQYLKNTQLITPWGWGYP